MNTNKSVDVVDAVTLSNTDLLQIANMHVKNNSNNSTIRGK